MDSSAEWTANALFSPSKARAQQALAKDWAALDAWLSKKYGSKRLPNFERNEDVLQALLTLANVNESADEQRGYIERVEKTALQAMSKRRSPFEEAILKSLLGYFSNEDHLDILTDAAVELQCPTANPAEMGEKMIELSTTAFETAQSLKRTELQLAALKTEEERMSALLKDLKVDAFKPPHDLLEKTAEWTKSTKQLKAKVSEYDERLSTTRPVSSSAKSFDQYLKLVRDVEDQRIQLSALNTELQAFQDLPSDARAARAKVEAARDQLRKAVAKREKLFENMTDR